MKLLAMIIVSILLASCYTTSNNVRSGYDFDKEVSVNNTSFFGSFRYTTGKLPKYTNPRQALYRNDSLKYISISKKKHTRKSNVWKVIHLSDTMTMLTNNFDGRYFREDTLVFFKDECYIKRIDYQVTYRERLPVRTEFERHEFGTDNYVTTDESFHYPDSIDTRKSIRDYIAECRVRQPGKGPDKATITWQSYPLSGRDTMMLTFFRSRFYY